MTVELLTEAQYQRLRANHDANEAMLEATDGASTDYRPVVKLFDAYGQAWWLLTELDPNGDTAWGLADLGLGFCELGSVSLNELRALKIRFGHDDWLPRIERDRWFKADRTLSEYQQARIDDEGFRP